MIHFGADHLLTYWDHYKSFSHASPDDLIKGLINGEEWADHLIIQALSRSLKITIVMVRSDRQPPQVIKQEKHHAIVYLGYEVGLHYWSLIRDDHIVAVNDINAHVNDSSVDVFMRRVAIMGTVATFFESKVAAAGLKPSVAQTVAQLCTEYVGDSKPSAP